MFKLLLVASIYGRNLREENCFEEPSKQAMGRHMYSTECIVLPTANNINLCFCKGRAHTHKNRAKPREGGGSTRVRENLTPFQGRKTTEKCAVTSTSLAA